MIFFKKKKPEASVNLSPTQKPASIPSMAVAERIITAEGWRRQMEKKLQKSKEKS